MRLFCYYALHSFCGVIRKLFHTWVAVILLVSILFGAAVGLGFGLLMDETAPETVETAEAPAPEEPIDDPVIDIELPWDGLTGMQILELVLSGGILVIFCLQLLTGEKSGGRIFQMADANLLFPSPHKPQSILLFRLMTQMGLYLIITLYLTLQIPNLIHSFDLAPAVGWSLLAVFFFTLVFAQLISVLIYTLTSTYPRLSGKFKLALYVLILAVGGAYVLFCRLKDYAALEGAAAFFCAPWTRFIPVFGFLKAIPLLIEAGNVPLLIADLVALTLFAAGLCVWIWSINADFYEDALQKASEREELMQKARESKTGMAFKSRKRKEDPDLAQLSFFGQGSAVYFAKSIQSRFRGAFGGVLTKTGTTYLVLAILIGVGARFLLQTHSSLVLAVPFSIAVFFRTFGNPIGEDSSKHFFALIPEKPFAKIFYSMLGGTADTLLDLIPALIVGELLVAAPIWKLLFWLLFLISFDFYASSFGLFADLILPESIPQKVKSAVQVMLIYFSVIPGAAALVIGDVLHRDFVGVAAATVIHFGIGLLFHTVSAAQLQAGRK